jgi:phage gpG-like protein
MISVLANAAGAIAALRTRRGAFRARLRDGFAQNAQTLLAMVRAKLSGEVLQARSGALRASMRAEVAEEAHGFAARVWSDGSLPYARIQEYGGRVAIPEIRANNAKALAFVYGGRLVFARRVRAHAVTIPERGYMRSSLDDFVPVFADSIRRLARETSP